MRLFVATAAFILLCTACGSGDDDVLPVPGADTVASSSSTTEAPPAAATTTETTESSTTTEAADEAIPEPSDGEVFDEYIADVVEQYFEVVSQALAAPSPSPEVDFPAFAEFSAGEQLQVAHDGVREAFENGWADREPEEPAVGTTTDEELRVSGIQTINDSEDEVTVFRCRVFDDETYNVETGVTEIAGTLTTLSVVTLQKLDGTWKMTNSVVSQKIRGVAGCYLASDADFPY